MWRRPIVATSTRELEMRVGSRQGKEDSAVALVVVETAELGQPEAIAVEVDDLVKPLCVSREPNLHQRESFTSRAGLRKHGQRLVAEVALKYDCLAITDDNSDGPQRGTPCTRR